MARNLPRVGLLVLFACLLLAPASASAGNNGYFTTYNSEVEKGEFELMLMNDLTSPSAFNRAAGQGDYLSHMLELEYGVTSKLATELMVEWFEDLETGARRFTGFRWEARYRLFQAHVPLNPMLYVEYEDLDPGTRYKMEVSGWVKPPYDAHEKPAARERVLESRLVLSDKLGPLDLAFNAVVETDLGTRVTAFGYSAGVMWMPGHGMSMPGHGDDGAACDLPPPAAASYECPMHPHETSATPGKCSQCGMDLVPRAAASAAPAAAPACGCKTSMPGCRCGHCSGDGGDCDCAHAGMVGVGLEVFGGVGDTIAFGLRPSLQQHYLGPILVYHPTPRIMVHSQLAIGLSGASDELARVNVGYEF